MSWHFNPFPSVVAASFPGGDAMLAQLEQEKQKERNNSSPQAQAEVLQDSARNVTLFLPAVLLFCNTGYSGKIDATA